MKKGEMKNIASARKSSEGFVQWKERSSSKTGHSAGASTSQIVGQRPKTGIPNLSSTGLVPPTRYSIPRRGGQVLEGLKSSESQGERIHNSSISANNVDVHEDTSDMRNRGLSNAEKDVRNSVWRGPTTSLGRQIHQIQRESHVSTMLPTLNRMVRGASCVGRDSMNLSNLPTILREAVDRSAVPSRAQEQLLQNKDALNFCWEGQTHAIPESLRTLLTASTTENSDEQEADEEDEDYGEMRCAPENSQPHYIPQGYDSYDDNPNDDNPHSNVIYGNSDEVEEAHAMQEMASADGRDVMAVLEEDAADESAKRRERRQVQAARAREGERHRKEGLRRNYLLVDEYTHKPYGAGVGEWRKEIMLLSRKLDPAIGNINRQPDGAVAEIAEWIQHTWEYSAPVKFDFVKEVVARGVTLRRAEFWNKIRNNEDKPEGISDRSWRSLERQLQSPATMKKSENCSKANAARINFGRTGPSGEIGVRERLRRMFRRSPEPEEIQREMSRNKGYGGRLRTNSKCLSVMHRSKEQFPLGMQLQRMTEPVQNMYNNAEAIGDNNRHENNIDDEGNGEVRCGGGRDEGLSLGGVMSMSAEEISQHPMVLQMIHRLEALEGLQRARQLSTDTVETMKGTDSTEETNDEDKGTQQQEEDAGDLELQEKRAPRKPGRPRKKARNN